MGIVTQYDTHECRRYYIMLRANRLVCFWFASQAVFLSSNLRNVNLLFYFLFKKMSSIRNWQQILPQNRDEGVIQIQCISFFLPFHCVLWTARSNQSILKEINTKYLLEGLMLKLKLQHIGHLMPRADSLCWERLRAKGEWGDRGRDGWMVSLTQRT